MGDGGETASRQTEKRLTDKTWSGPPLSPFRKEILKMDHLHHDGDILLCSRAQVVLEITLPLQLEDHLLDGRTLAADTAELVAKPVCHTLQSILDKRFTLYEKQTHKLSS